MFLPAHSWADAPERSIVRARSAKRESMRLAAILFAPFAIFISQPLLALLPAGAYTALYRASSRRLVGAAAVLWFLYTPYEYGMHRRWLCSGECNIRVDLLLLYPVLWLVSLAAAIVGVRAINRRRGLNRGV